MNSLINLFAICILIITALVFFSRLRVPPNTILIIERIGKFHRAVSGGTYFKIPVIDQVNGLISTLTESDTFKLDIPTEAKEVLHVTLFLNWELLNTGTENIKKVAYQFKDSIKRKEALSEIIKIKVAGFFFNRSKSIALSDYEDLSEALKLQLGSAMKIMGYRLISLQLKDLYQD
ncbi:SPFH domain-containing protein [Pedobacter sp. KBW06]|uniref:SPFH domain-containing protein n=1 Tax=Pedobacter sp. KBW06 TaxID=2153359 RepID=UPI0013157EC3|nr:SPFH domain-containing protein [Pedobacter sp. KBW06]